MILRILAFGTLLSTLLYSASAQVTLQPWTEVFGTVNGQQLGKYVTGITPSANLPYKAAVSKVASTGIYRIDSPTDTSAQQIYLGENVLTGDLNNDGYKDVVMSKTVNNYDTVFIYWGSASGIDTLTPLKIPGENQYDGLKPGCVGDVNNDGLIDLILTAPSYPALLSVGKVYFFFGPIGAATPSATLQGDSTFAGLGIVVQVGDLNDDGLKDLIIRGKNQQGPPGPQRYDYFNIYSGVGADTLNLTLSTQMRTSSIPVFGLAVFDANGDGHDDLIWAIQDSQATRINVHYGRTNFDTIPDLQLQNPGVGTFGFTIVNGGDMNGDGYNDIVVGCPDASVTSGIVLVYGGGPQIDRFFDAAVSRSAASYFGRSVSSLGDISGDGLADIIVGRPLYPDGNERGYWGVFKGDSAITVTSVGTERAIPTNFFLEQAYPNPFNPTVTIGFTVRQSATVKITVFDILGQEITTLVDEEKLPGRYEVTFNGQGYASGVYYYRMTARINNGPVFSDTKHMLLVK